tara:strand:+ start:4264 stop:11613 length:7350 start_codon:yes stop_codon:yes gene_type:complete
MNEEYLKGLHSYLEIEDDYDTWVSSISNNDEYLKGLHKYLEIEDDYDVWNSSVFGGEPVSTEIEKVEIPVEETQEPIEEVEIKKEVEVEKEEPNFFQDKLARLARGILSTGKGLEEAKTGLFLTAADFAMDIFSPEVKGKDRLEVLKAIKMYRDLPIASGIEGYDKDIKSLGKYISEYDSESIVDDIIEGRYGQAADRAIGGVFESAPSLALAFLGPGGLITLGTSAAGNKFDEEFEENPEEGVKRIFLNSALSGTAEATFELVTRGILGRATGLIKSGNKRAAKELIDNYSTKLLKRLATDPLAEGVSEAATEFSVDLIDLATLQSAGDFKEAIPFTEEFDESNFYSKNWKKWSDAGIIGTVTGGGIVTTGALTSNDKAVRDAAEYTLTPESDKKIITNAALEINNLNEQIKQANNKEEVFDLENMISEQEQIVINTRQKVSEELNMMNPDELKNYAEGIDNIAKEKRRLNSFFSPILKTKTQEQINELQYQNDEILRKSIDRRLDENIKTVGVEDLGRTVNDYNSKEDYQKAYDNTEQGKKNSMNVTSSDGFISEDGDIYINREVAQKVRNVNVAAHELLHGILNNNIKEPGQLKKLVNEFKAVLPRDVANLIQKRIDNNYRFTTDEQGNRVERSESEYMEEYFTAFADLIGNRQIKFNENIFGKIGEKITPIFKGKGYGHIKFETGKDVYNFIKDYQKQIAKGELKPETIEAARKVAKQDIDTKFSKTEENRKIKDIFDKFTGPAENRKFKSKEEFKNSPEFFEALLEIEQSNTLDASIRNTVSQAYLNMNPGFVKEVKERISDKYQSEYDASKNSLFGWLTGKNKAGQTIIQLSAGDIQAKKGKQPTTVTTTKKVGGEDSKTTIAETLVSDEISPEEYADMKLAQDKLKKIKPQQSKIADKINLTDNEINLAKRDIINFLRKTDRPSMTDPKKFFKAFVDYTTGSGVQPGGFAKVIYDKLSLPKDGRLSTKNRKAFIESITEDLIALNKVDPAVMRRSKWTPFYELEIKNMNPTQMQKAIDEGRIPSTSNLKSGLDLFKTLDPSVGQVVDYLMGIRPDVLKRKMPKFLAEVIVKNEFNEILNNPKQPVYDAKGNKTDNTIDLSETITEEEVVRGAPQVREKIARPKGVKFSKSLKDKVKKVIAESAKTTTAKEKQGINADIERAYGGFLDHSNPDDFKKFENDIVDIFAPEFGSDIFSYTTSQTLAAAGRNAFGSKPSTGAVGAKFWYVSDIEKVTDVQKLGETTSMIEAGYIGNLTELNNKIAKKLNLKIPTPKNRIYIAKAQTLKNLEYNKENLNLINKEKRNILDKWKEIYDEHPKSRPSIKELQYNNNANAAVSKNEALVLDSMDGANEFNKYEEHGYQHGEYSLDKAKAMSSKVDGVWEFWKNYAEKEYKQMVFNKTTRIKSIKGDMRTYQGIVDLTYNLPEYGEWKAKSEKYPLVSEMMDIAMKTGKKSDWDKVPPASDMRFFNEKIKLNPFILKTFYNGKTITFAEKYNLNVPKKFQNNPNVYELVSDLIFEINKTKAGKLTGDLAMKSTKAQDIINDYLKTAPSQLKAAKFSKSMLNDSKVLNLEGDLSMEDLLSKAATLDNALANARKLDAPVKKIRVFDFDDTLARTKSIVFYTKPDGTEGQLTAEEFAEKGADLVAEGAVMDFSDFNIVREGKRGPLFDVAKKIRDARGNEDLFVLTARAPESADAIYEFLKSEGLEFKIENIVGLGNSTGAAKANWVVDKAADGYNDFYFADDAYANVQAVQDALDQIDVKSKVQQAKVKFSKSIDEDFNKIIEQTTGIASEKRYSKAKAKVRGANKGNKKFFIPYSAEDFMGLVYPLLSKGKLGDSQMAWFKEHLLDPYGRAIENLSSDRIQMMQDFKELKKSLEVPKDLRKTNDSGFTNEQAVRVYLFNKMGYEVPGLSKTDLSELVDIINSDGKLKAFADQILSVTKGDGYVKPSQEWLAGTITTDLIDLLNTTKRRKYLEQSGYLDNANEIFSTENLNKLEAAYGAKYREAVENVLSRMKSGKNRMFSGNRLSNRVLDYINGSIGTIMFFNTRSAVLQTISAVNFLNWSFNNPYKAGKAFANQKQYWKDFKMLMNSDYLTDRRNGLKLNINENEIANAAATAKNKARGVMNYILQKGYLPTQFADSFAIASGGATFYRNRVNDLVNQGVELKQAEQQALSEWKETAEISQQSSDPSKISQQQASDLGRVILAFANTPMQYARIQKRAFQDLVNKRGDAKTHVSKIIYYGVVQNLIFNALQQALFAIGFGDDEDEENEKKYLGVANGMLDSTLRGLGIAGATVAVIKNFLIDIYERSDRPRPEYVDAVYKLLQLSPPISSKISKIRQAAYQFDSKKRRQEIFDKGFSLDNPAYEAAAKIISATTNLPLDRVLNKVNNIEAALGEDAETWQIIAMLAGWPEWQIMAKKKKKEELPKFPGKKIQFKKEIEFK